MCSLGKNNCAAMGKSISKHRKNESYKQTKMIKEEMMLLIMGAVRYMRKEGDKRTESFVPKLDE